MRYVHDKKSSKFYLLAIVVIIIYLSFFGFDLKKAYNYTIGQNEDVIEQIKSN